jgi:hypothetical protein
VCARTLNHQLQASDLLPTGLKPRRLFVFQGKKKTKSTEDTKGSRT